MSIFMYSLVFVFGLIIGSFLNVCIYRVPLGKSLVRPGSACPGCSSPIKPYDNIPVFSYLVLGGRCRHCKTVISPRYPAVELLTGLLFLAVFITCGPHLLFPILAVFLSSLVVVSFIDLDLQIIPDRITLPGMALGLLCSFWNTSLGSGGQRIMASAIGLVAGGLLFYLIAMLGAALFKKESMGGGDIKLAAMIGAFLGWKGALIAFFLAFVAGAVIGLVVMCVGRKDRSAQIPFGPFLALGAAGSIFFGHFISKAYWSYVSVF